MSQTTRHTSAHEKYLWFTGPIRWPKPKLARLYNYQLGRMTSNGIEWATTKNSWVLREEGNETEVYIRKLCWFGCRIYNCVFRYFRNGIYRCGNIVVRFRISYFEQKIKTEKNCRQCGKEKESRRRMLCGMCYQTTQLVPSRRRPYPTDARHRRMIVGRNIVLPN